MLINIIQGSDKIRTLEEMQRLFAEKGYNLLSTEYNGNKIPLVFEKDGYIYQNTYNGFIKTDNPKKWGNSNPYSIANIKKYLKDIGATCEVLSTEYDYNLIKLKCKCGKEYETSTNSLLTKKQFVCPKCGRQRGAYNHRLDDKFLPLLDKYEITLLEGYKGSKYHHWAKTKEGYITKVQLYSLSKNINFYSFVFDIGNPYSLDNIKLWLRLNNTGLEICSEKYEGAKARYIFKCACGNQFETSWQYIYLNHITRCPKCTHKLSGLELKTREWLDENNIDYIPEKVFPDCIYKLPLRFDFYLPDLNKIIEVDGQQHYVPSSFGNRSEKEAIKAFENTRIRDKIKDDYCNKNNISLIRIPYTAFRTNKYKEILLTFTAKN